MSFDIEKGNYVKYTTLDRLPHNDVRAIAQDNQGNISVGINVRDVSCYSVR